MSEEHPGVVVVGPDEGRQVVRLNGEETIVKIGKADPGDAYAVRENRVPPGFACVPRHVHRDAEEAFYVLAGRLALWAAGERVDAPAGTFVLVPRGTVHSLANLGDEPVRWLTVISPASVAEWVEAEHELILTSGGHPDPQALAEIHRQFGPGDRRASACVVSEVHRREIRSCVAPTRDRAEMYFPGPADLFPSSARYGRVAARP